MITAKDESEMEVQLFLICDRNNKFLVNHSLNVPCDTESFLLWSGILANGLCGLCSCYNNTTQIVIVQRVYRVAIN